MLLILLLNSRLTRSILDSACLESVRMHRTNGRKTQKLTQSELDLFFLQMPYKENKQKSATQCMLPKIF